MDNYNNIPVVVDEQPMDPLYQLKQDIAHDIKDSKLMAKDFFLERIQNHITLDQITLDKIIQKYETEIDGKIYVDFSKAINLIYAVMRTGVKIRLNKKNLAQIRENSQQIEKSVFSRRLTQIPSQMSKQITIKSARRSVPLLESVQSTRNVDEDIFVNKIQSQNSNDRFINHTMYQTDFKDTRSKQKQQIPRKQVRSISILKPNIASDIFKKANQNYMQNIAKNRDVSEAREAIETCGEYRQVQSTLVSPQQRLCESSPNKEINMSSRLLQKRESYTNALNYRRHRQDFPMFAYSQIRNEDKSPDLQITNGPFQGMSTQELLLMRNVIKQFNQAEVPLFQLNSLRRMIQLEFINNQENEKHHFADVYLELTRFKEIFKKTIRMQLDETTLHQLYLAICDEKMEYVQYEKFNRFCDLFFFTPGKVIKHKNDSQQLYLIMSSMKNDKAHILTKKPIQKNHTQDKLVENFAMRLMQKFKKIGDAFRHFDRNFDNAISFKEFRIVVEEMDFRYSKKELQELFSYLDSDGGGTIGYLEFTKLLDEKRLGIDPFIDQKNDEMDIFIKNQQLFDFERFKGKNQNNVTELKQKIRECTSKKLAKFKHRQMSFHYRPESVKNDSDLNPTSTVYGLKVTRHTETMQSLMSDQYKRDYLADKIKKKFPRQDQLKKYVKI